MLKILLPSFAAIATVVIVIVILVTRPQGDAPTASSSDDNLKVQTLPSGLPQLAFVPPRSDAASASFDQLLDQAQTASRLIGQGGFESRSREEAAKVCDVLKALAAAAPLEKGFADKHIGPRDLNDPEMKRRLTVVMSAIKLHTDQLIESGQYDPASETAGAYFVLGQNLYENNTRLRPRQAGLMMMRSALTTWLRIAKAQSDAGRLPADQLSKITAAAQKWFDAIRAIETAWDIKLKSIDIPDPNVGDLVRVAQMDQDPSFRVFAVRRLGLARFEHGDRGNITAIDKAIDAAKASDDPMIRSAAETAQTLTKEQFRQVTR